MRCIIAVASGFVVGIVAMLAVLMLTGGWYEYRLSGPGMTARDLVGQGWEPFQVGDSIAFRRPRVRLNREVGPGATAVPTEAPKPAR